MSSQKNRRRLLQSERILVDNLISKLKGTPDDGSRDQEEDLRALVALGRTHLDKLSTEQESRCSIQADENPDGLARLSAWIRENAPGSHIGESFEFSSNLPEGNGVIATRSMDKGIEFMSIPRKLMMTIEDALSSRIGSLFVQDPLCMQSPSLFLVLFLIYENRNSDSFWRSYMDSLPRVVDLPFTWPLEDIDLLRGSLLYDEALKLSLVTMRQYTYIYDIIRKKENFVRDSPPTWHEFIWAVSIVMSRQNRIPSAEADGYSIALIPGWDMCNYRDGSMGTFYNPEKDSSESFTMEPVEKGNQIFIFYGTRPNHELMLYQGFFYCGSTSDGFRLDLHLPGDEGSDPLYKMRKLFLSKKGLSIRRQPLLVRIDQDGRIGNPSTMYYLRVLVMTKDEAAFALKNPEKTFWSKENEKKALAILLEKLHYALDKKSQHGRMTEFVQASKRHTLIQGYLNSETSLLEKLIKTTRSEIEST